jgi:phosphocarrier protein HPr
MASEAANELRRAVTIVNQKGLHARASAKFVNAVAAMDGCSVQVCREATSAEGGSILGLMMLGAARGDTIEIVVSGKDAETRLDLLAALVADGFGET